MDLALLHGARNVSMYSQRATTAMVDDLMLLEEEIAIHKVDGVGEVTRALKRRNGVGLAPKERQVGPSYDERAVED